MYGTLAALDDFHVSMSDVLISDPEGVLIYVTLFNDSLAGEPVENFTLSALPPASPAPYDALYLFRESVINIVDVNSEE